MRERELIERSRRGDREAQRALYERTHRRIHRLAVKMTDTADDALDVTQETYFRAFSRIHQFNGRCAFSTWLYRIAVHEAIQRMRRTRRAKERAAVVTVEDRTPSTDRAQAVRLDVHQALASLSGQDRAILLLRYEHDLDYRAIADSLSIAEGTVASRLNRARNRLREKLQRSYENREEKTVSEHPKST